MPQRWIWQVLVSHLVNLLPKRYWYLSVLIQPYNCHEKLQNKFQLLLIIFKNMSLCLYIPIGCETVIYLFFIILIINIFFTGKEKFHSRFWFQSRETSLRLPRMPFLGQQAQRFPKAHAPTQLFTGLPLHRLQSWWQFQMQHNQSHRADERARRFGAH